MKLITLLSLLITFLVSCASLTTGTTQRIEIDTKPKRASCEIFNNGKSIATIPSTPGKTDVHKAATALVITCTLDGYLTNSGSIASKYQSMVWGNILFGGLIGVAIDSGTGSIYRYDPKVTINLIPESFPTNNERDIFFNQMKESLAKESNQFIKQIKESCSSNSSCENQLIEAKSDTKIKLSEIEFARRRARVLQNSETEQQ